VIHAVAIPKIPNPFSVLHPIAAARAKQPDSAPRRKIPAARCRRTEFGIAIPRAIPHTGAGICIGWSFNPGGTKASGSWSAKP